MQKIIDFFTVHYVGVCILGGGVMSFIVALLRQKQAKIKPFSVCVSEALLCAFLSSGIAQVAIYFFSMRPESSMFIGTFCGFLGTDFLKSLLRSLIENYANRTLKK